MTRTRLLVVLVVLLATAACSGSSPSGTKQVGASSTRAAPTQPQPSPATSGAGSPSTPPVSIPPAPARAACYRMDTADLTRPTASDDPVSCRSRHTARTIYVGTLDSVVDGHAVAVDSTVVQDQLARTCPRKLRSYVGANRATLALSRINVVWFSPTLRQSDAGADWFRCDLVAFASGEKLYPLPRGGKLRGVLADPSALDTYGLCGTAAPGDSGFERVICERRHSWRAVDTITLAGGTAYPGRATVRKAGDSRCKDEVRARSQDALKFQYGWEWPTRGQWRRGQHYGYCWAPD